jgi:hypothetical protein
MRTAQNLTWLSGAGSQVMFSVEGMTRLTWQAIKRNHPNVTESEIAAQLFSAENVDAARVQFENLNTRKKTKNLKATTKTRRGKGKKRKNRKKNRQREKRYTRL